MIKEDFKNGDGRQILPSAFPLFKDGELNFLRDKDFSEVLSFFADFYGVAVDGNKAEPILTDLTDGLYLIDLTFGGEEIANTTDSGISPYLSACVYSAYINLYDDFSTKINVSVPLDEVAVNTLVSLKRSGFPIDRIIIPSNEDFDGEDVSMVDVTSEDIAEYLKNFYEDFDYPLGIEDGKSFLALEMYNGGFEDVLAINLFGLICSPIENCFAYFGKGVKDEKTAVRKLSQEFAIDFKVSKKREKSDAFVKELCKKA